MAASTMRAHSFPPVAVGVALAFVAAVAFGLTTPVIARASAGLGPLGTSALLYGGAAGTALLARIFGRPDGSPIARSDVPRVALVAFFGAALAPTLLVFGVARTGPTATSLILNLEATFSVALAWLVYREPVGSRVAAAVGLILLGGALVTLDGREQLTRFGGMVAVVAATFFWAVDNTLTRALSERDPSEVVLAKSTLGALATGIAAIIFGEPLANGAQAAAILACGALGYGASLRLYLLAQRRIGAARTASVFAVGPFIGAAVSFVIGERDAGMGTFAGALALGLGVYLHVTERHAHFHVHPGLEHEHAHRHDDGHHDDHTHEPPVLGEHTQRHRHEPREHDHAHGIDIHHDHDHG